ncbi:MAG TPA: hypothetical protein DCL77_14700 [Prolixibacteraceae bacterium]|jgi:hypothetical protein|nr:hypothetical protein [Prolixibacteraceae bacterium]
MENDKINIHVLSMRYESFMKKCIGINLKERHRIKSDNMILLLSYHNARFENIKSSERFEKQFEMVQDNLIFALSQLKLKNGLIDRVSIEKLERNFITASSIDHLNKGIEIGIEIIS